MTIGEQLKIERKKQGIILTKLEELSGLSKTTCMQVEKNEDVRVSSIVRYAQALGKNIVIELV